jgi:hypothetical protein
MKEKFIQYCNDNWDIVWYKMCEASGAIDEWRCPLSMVGGFADEIIDRIAELAEEFIEENDLDPDWFENNFDNEEEVFWGLDPKFWDEDSNKED